MSNLYSYIFDTIDGSKAWNRAKFHPERVIEDVANIVMAFLDNRLGSALTEYGRGFEQIMDGLCDYIVRSVTNPTPNDVVELTEAFMYEVICKTFDVRDRRDERELNKLLQDIERNNSIIIEEQRRSQPRHAHRNYGHSYGHQPRSGGYMSSGGYKYNSHHPTPTQGRFQTGEISVTIKGDMRSDEQISTTSKLIQTGGTAVVNNTPVQKPEVKQQSTTTVAKPKDESTPSDENILYWAGEEIVVVRDRTNTYEIIERSNVEFDYEKHRTDRFLKPRMLNNGSVASEALMKRVDEAIQTTVDKFIVNNGEGESDEVSYKFSPESNLLVEDLQYVEIHGNFYKELINKFGEITSVSSRELKKFTIITPILNIINDVPSLSPLALHNTWTGFLTAINNGVTDIGTRLKLSQYIDESLNIAFIEHGYSFEIEDAIACRDDLFNWMNDTLNKDEAAKFNSSFIDYLKVGTGEYEDGVHLCFRENVIHLPITRDELNWFTTVNDMFCKVVLSGSKIYSLLKPIFDLDIDDEERHPLNNIIIVLNDGMVISAYYSKKNDRMYLFKRDL